MCNYYINKKTTNIHLNSEFSITVTGMSFLYVTLVTEGALIIFFPDKKRQGALIGAGALNGANTVVKPRPAYVVTSIKGSPVLSSHLF